MTIREPSRRDCSATVVAGVPARTGNLIRLLQCAAAISVLAITSASAYGQISPPKALATVRNPIVVDVRPPRSAEAPVLRLELITAAGQVLDTQSVKPGSVNLAELFPRLWKTDVPQVLFAQLTVETSSKDGTRSKPERFGSALVLVPMLASRYAARVDRDGLPVFSPPPKQRPLAGYWLFVDQVLVVKTSKGELTFALRAEAAPKSVRHVRRLVQDRFYDGTKILRIASLRGQPQPDIVQFGDPTMTGHGDSGDHVDFEDSPIKHGYGTLSIARGSDPNSGGSQLVIALSRAGAANMDGRYAAIAELVAGAETLALLAKTPVDAEGQPSQAVVIESATLKDAPPRGDGQEPLKDPLDKAQQR